MIFDYGKCLFTFVMKNVSIGLNINNTVKIELNMGYDICSYFYRKIKNVFHN